MSWGGALPLLNAAVLQHNDGELSSSPSSVAALDALLLFLCVYSEQDLTSSSLSLHAKARVSVLYFSKQKHGTAKGSENGEFLHRNKQTQLSPFRRHCWFAACKGNCVKYHCKILLPWQCLLRLINTIYLTETSVFVIKEINKTFIV